MTERQAHIAFNLTERVGVVTLGRLMGESGSAVAAWENYANKTSRAGGEVDWEKEERLAEQFGVRIVTLADDDYPKLLKDSPGAPLVLYIKGELSALSEPGVALIGTRRATAYGQAQATKLAYELATAGVSVISGLALGIDAAAHRGALDAGGVTIGVIGSGLDKFYPEENRDLAREIVRKGGAVVSEFPFGRPADQTTFPIRNHVVAALSRGVVAVEAPFKSGTLITTGFAGELGRPVMAVPGRVDSRMSAGCLNLIREGATLVRNVDDILEATSPLMPSRKPKDDAAAVAEEPEERLPFSTEEALVMVHVDEDGISIDDLVHETGLSVEKVMSLTMELRIKGFLKFLPGNRVASGVRT